jgi:hypothetical protein
LVVSDRRCFSLLVWSTPQRPTRFREAATLLQARF